MPHAVGIAASAPAVVDSDSPVGDAIEAGVGSVVESNPPRGAAPAPFG